MTDPGTAPPLHAVPGVCDVTFVRPDGADPHATPRLLIDLPHGATTREHYDAVRNRLHSPLPHRLEAFYFVNTDVGSPEVGAWVAELVARPLAAPDLLLAWAASGAVEPPKPLATVLVRSHIPRTFIDCNRSADADPDALKTGALTGLLPEYITDPADRDALLDLHRRYHRVASHAHSLVCGVGGMALALHTYAPRSVGITTIDADIVRNLEAAYVPETYATWPERHPVDLITRDMNDTLRAPAELVAAIRKGYEEMGVPTAENGSYRLHPDTMGTRYALRHPDQVVSVELRRDLLADPFDPFVQMQISPEKARRMAIPLAVALLAWANR